MAKTKKIKIKDLKIGTKIKTKDKNGNIVFKRVTDKFNTTVSSENQVLLRFTNGSKLNCSTNHPILILGDGGEFIEKLPMDISNSDKIITESGITNLFSIDTYQQNDINYIDITVEDCHTFFASDAEFEEMILTHNSQGGLRKGSATLFFPIWHQEVEELIVLKNEKGNDENRARSLDYAVSISKIFYERFIKDENITLFSPHDVPGLYDAFGTDSFDDLYIHYEQDKSIPRKTVGAQKLIFDILNERSDTGRIYILNIDHTNSHGPYSKTVRMSNLCVAGDTKIRIRYPESVGDQYGTWYWNVLEKEIKIEDLEDYIIMRECEMYDSNAPQIEVISYNIESNEHQWAPITAFAETSPAAKVMKITDEESGKSIVVTPDHQVFTKNRGYVMAKDLTRTDELVIS